jgi:hypothetical protein
MRRLFVVNEMNEKRLFVFYLIGHSFATYWTVKALL